jgi:hypothetical protein
MLDLQCSAEEGESSVTTETMISANLVSHTDSIIQRVAEQQMRNEMARLETLIRGGCTRCGVGMLDFEKSPPEPRGFIIDYVGEKLPFCNRCIENHPAELRSHFGNGSSEPATGIEPVRSLHTPDRVPDARGE